MQCGRVDIPCGLRGPLVHVRRESGQWHSVRDITLECHPEQRSERSVHRHRQRTSKGLWLGLAISRELARGMEGALRLVNDEARGSTFTLTLPSA